MSDLPYLDFSEPRCGHCATETVNTGDGFECERCGLFWFHDNYDATDFADEDASPCGSEPPGDYWKRRKAFYRDSLGYELTAAPCSLPKGHASAHYYPTLLTALDEAPQ